MNDTPSLTFKSCPHAVYWCPECDGPRLLSNELSFSTEGTHHLEYSEINLSDSPYENNNPELHNHNNTPDDNINEYYYAPYVELYRHAFPLNTKKYNKTTLKDEYLNRDK